MNAENKEKFLTILFHHLEPTGSYYMTQARLIILSAGISLLISIPALATPVGEHAGEIWVDGPADMQPGADPGNPDAAVDGMGRSIFVWDGTPPTPERKSFFESFPPTAVHPGIRFRSIPSMKTISTFPV